MNIAFIRSPVKSRYNDSDVREENLVTYAIGFLESQAITLSYKIFDYALDYTLGSEELVSEHFNYHVICIRETASSPHYALRVAELLTQKGASNVIIYGQIGRLAYHPEVAAKLKLKTIIHSEDKLAQHLFPDKVINKKNFSNGGFTPPLCQTSCRLY